MEIDKLDLVLVERSGKESEASIPRYLSPTDFPARRRCQHICTYFKSASAQLRRKFTLLQSLEVSGVFSEVCL